ncbi:MAG: helix-turn-helix domain-containing protein [Magnetococcales bacterium]|nr:helix-turn-helix domain-containing protein [Magnetococcales bacterium]
MEIRPIKTEQDYDNALAEVERLMDAAPDTPEGDRLDLLTTLIETYESRHYAIDIPDPIDAIKFQMEQMGLSRKELEPFIGSRARVAEILNRKRHLSLEMIRRLHKGLKIPASVLIQPTRQGHSCLQRDVPSALSVQS